MKHVRAVFELSAERRHPMHQFAVDSDDVTDYELLAWTPTPDDSVALLLRFAGDVAPYRRRIREVDSTAVASVADGDSDHVYVYVRDDLDGPLGHTVARFVELGLVVVPPVEYRDDGTVAASIVGPGDRVHDAVDTLPDDVGVVVESVTEYGGSAAESSAGLTDAQRDAVEAAVDCGYYEPTREGSVEAVGDRLGCSASAAAERLRRAEATVMRRVVGDAPERTR